MAYDLEKVNVPILFTQGLDTKTNEKLLPPGGLLVCKNGQFQESSISKRFGTDLLNAVTTDGEFITNGHTLMNYEDELLLLGNGNQLLSYLPSADLFVEKGIIYLAAVEQNTLVFNTEEQLHVDSSIQDGIEGYAWEDSRGGVRYSILDHENGVSYVSDAVLDSSGTDPQVCSIPGYLFFFYCVSGGLFMRKVSTSNPTEISTEVEVTTGLNTTTPLLQVRNLSSTFIALYETSGNTIKFHYVTADGEIGDIGNGFPNAITISDNPTCLCLDISMGDGSTDPLLGDSRFAVGWQSTSGVFFRYYDSGFQDIYGGSETIDAATDTVSNITVTHAGDHDEFIFFFYELRSSGQPQNTRVKMASSNVSTQVTVVGTGYRRSVGLASQAFKVDVNPHVFLVHASKNSLQDTIFLSIRDITEIVTKIILKLTPGESGGLSTKPRLPKVERIEENLYLFPSQFKDVLTGDVSSFFSSLGVKKNIISFGMDMLPISSLEHGKHLFIAAGVLLSYDGKEIVDAGFHYFPEGLTVADGGAGNVVDGLYQYTAVYKWYNNKGEMERSASAIPIEYTVSSGPQRSDVTIPTLRITGGKTNVVIELYRNEVNGGNTFRLVAVADNDTVADTVTIQDDLTDANLIDNEPLYASGGILDNGFYPSAKTLEEHQTRLFLVPRENDTHSIFSKRHADNIFTEIVNEFDMRASSRKPITAQRSMDANLITFSRDDIFGSIGEGPDETGSGSFYTEPTLIHGDVGSVDGVIAKIPGGLIFKSAKGIYLLTRGLEVQYIGAQVEAYNSFNITSAVLVDDLNEARFTTQEGITLTYHYLTGNWSTFEHRTNINNLNDAVGRVHATVFDGEWTLLSYNGKVLQEDKTKHKDGNLYYPMVLGTGWVKLRNLVAGLQRITQCTLTGEYKSAHLLRVKVAYDYEDSWVDRYYFSTADNLADGVNYFGSDLKFGIPGPVFFYDRFTNNNDSNWTNVTIDGGPIEVTENKKHIYGSGILANQLGFYGEIPNSGGSLAGNILQFELNIDPDTTSAICLGSVSLSSGIDSAASVSIEFNSFPTPHIKILDYTLGDVPGAMDLSEFDLTKQYVGKFLFNANGTITAYVDGEGLGNHELGTTDLADDFTEGPIYFSTFQSFITPETNSTIWDDIFFHREGLAFDYESFQKTDNNYFGGITNNVYQFRFFLSRPKCQALKFMIEDIVDTSILATPPSGESFSITELMLTAKVKPQPKKFGTDKSLERTGAGSPG